MPYKIVIVGAGFAGLRLARKLNNHQGFEVLLIDRYNYHQFQPLFYQVATSALDPSNISFPLRKAFHKSRNVRIRLATVESISTQEKIVHTDMGDFEYDILVVATGGDTTCIGNKQFIDNAFLLKSTVES